MSWFKTSQISPKTYTDVGHGYEMTEEGRKEKWQIGKSWSAFLWYFDGNEINSEPRTKENTAHWIPEQTPAKGRIDIENKTGSIDFNPDVSVSVRKQVIKALVGKFSDIKFFVFEHGCPYSLQEYWNNL